MKSIKRIKNKFLTCSNKYLQIEYNFLYWNRIETKKTEEPNYDLFL